MFGLFSLEIGQEQISIYLMFFFKNITVTQKINFFQATDIFALNALVRLYDLSYDAFSKAIVEYFC